ncbi:Sde2 N-terminal domain-containing protein [Heracleum sosnowskyi]|uniref:Sde2 N-terminal domain-containing protein n=1 Tax=Heracleum sosnowskyi TaxID=360622 RepID=A0AAD8HB07_9APIA|nr:Sde2 N-terminal domain-containing protein [Heracleum sosnowskyi]
MADTHQIHLKLLNGRTKTLNFTTPTIQITQIKTLIHSITSIPPHHQLLLSNGKLLQEPDEFIHLTHPINPISLLLRLRGGKGGFGSLLRGAGTKAGQKKTNNFDACRDLSGRRLRHVNAEKKMEEWNAEAAERRLEKVAEEFIKKQVKEGKKQAKGGESAVKKYVEKYVKDSEKCRMEVDKLVRESVGDFFRKRGKRKGGDKEAGSSKKSKIWKGKKKMDASDSDDTDEDDSDEEMGSVTGGKIDGESSAGCSLESTSSEQEKDIVVDRRIQSSENSPDGGVLKQEDGVKKPAVEIHEQSMVQEKSEPCLEVAVEVEASQNETEEFMEANVEKIVVVESPVVPTVVEDVPVVDKPLDFSEYGSAAEMEVLGMERLKTELQKQGLKCGGTLQERAARLFLLKTTPVEKLPKKLLAKK